MHSIQTLALNVMKHYRTHGRTHLPWRKTYDPYRVLVSEIMLQQTQVDRVVPKYLSFIKKFPTVRRLARAPFPKVLKEWQGLGYNRRAQFLHAAAKEVVAARQGVIPNEPMLLEELPGVGHYTARAVCVFAFNTPEVFIETNVRTVFTHHFFPRQKKVSDGELLPFIEEALVLARRKKVTPRKWYAALMDYGAYLKQQGVRINKKNTQYTKQKKFAGSTRQLRGMIVRELVCGPQTIGAFAKKTDRNIFEVQKVLNDLVKEKLVEKRSTKFFLPQ